tara:strand:- start:172 stop:351 length:180 start_codon:yes stop_codon:yes gene_type:complete
MEQLTEVAAVVDTKDHQEELVELVVVEMVEPTLVFQVQHLVLQILVVVAVVQQVLDQIY